MSRLKQKGKYAPLGNFEKSFWTVEGPGPCKGTSHKTYLNHPEQGRADKQDATKQDMVGLSGLHYLIFYIWLDLLVLPWLDACFGQKFAATVSLQIFILDSLHPTAHCFSDVWVLGHSLLLQTGMGRHCSRTYKQSRCKWSRARRQHMTRPHMQLDVR